MRTFLALELPRKTRRKLFQQARKITGLDPTKPEQIHLTLFFSAPRSASGSLAAG